MNARGGVATDARVPRSRQRGEPRRPPTVLQLRSSAGLYGAEHMLLGLGDGLRSLGVRNRMLAIHNPRLREQPLHAAALQAGLDSAVLPCNGRLDLRTVSALVAQIDTCDADVVHAHDYKSVFHAWLATRRRRHVRLVATIHGWVETSAALRLYNRMDLALLRRFDALVVVADDQAQRLRRAGVPAMRIHAIGNGIRIPAAQATADLHAALREDLGLQARQPVFATIGRLSSEKNVAAFVAAFAAVVERVPTAVGLVVGDGPCRDALQSQVARAGLQSNIRFLGVRDDIDAIYALVDCLVLPSTSEGMPLVALEAMARGIPVVASAVGDLPRLLANAGHGRLVAPGDVAGLATALCAALDDIGCHDACAAAWVRDHHSNHAMAARYHALYLDLHAQARRHGD